MQRHLFPGIVAIPLKPSRIFSDNSAEVASFSEQVTHKSVADEVRVGIRPRPGIEDEGSTMRPGVRQSQGLQVQSHSVEVDDVDIKRPRTPAPGPHTPKLRLNPLRRCKQGWRRKNSLRNHNGVEVVVLG